MNTKLKNAVVAILAFISAAFAQAKETTLWDGTCHNVTGQVDGFLKLYTTQVDATITGYISISGWLYGSGEISGKREGNSIRFISTDAGGGKIRWEGIVRNGVLDGEYFVDPDPKTGIGKEVGEFKVSVVDKQQDGRVDSEASFRKLFILSLEVDLNSPVKLADGSVAFGADAVFHSIHPAGEGVSIKVTDVDIDWKDGSLQKDAKDIRKYSIAYTLYWHGVVTTSGWTKMRLSYNANLGQVTDHTVIETTGTTNRDVNDIAFGIGVLLGKAAVDSLMNSH